MTDKIFKEKRNEFTLLLEGNANFDYYIYNNHVYSIAKEGSGCTSTMFSDLDYFNRIKDRL